MELNINRPALAGQNIDPDTFQRVWDRVMPEPAAQDATPPAVSPDTAAQPSPSEDSLQPPVEEAPAPELPPVPDCPAQPDCPECPSCPECPECPSCPETPGLTPPAFCLGDASQGDSGRLEELMVLALAGAAAGKAMARRAGGLCAKTLAALACDHRLALRRLSAAYFLITGRRYCPKCAAPVLPASLALALRQQFLWEQQWELKNNQAAQATADPCLKELYQELAQEGAFHAGSIRSLLEQMS